MINCTTLVISKDVNNHRYYKKHLETIGFGSVTITALDRDALYSIIRDLSPHLIIMSARFYHCCTPFIMGILHRYFPAIKLAAVSLGDYPVDIAMYFILNGINSYINSFDGFDQFNRGLEEIAKGRDYVSPSVLERLNQRLEKPKAAGNITNRQHEVIRLICCGFKDLDIADTLGISRRTVDKHKTDIFTSLNVRSAVELLRVAITLHLITIDELYFYPQGLSVNPKPNKELFSEKFM